MSDLISREKLLKKLNEIIFDATEASDNGTLCISHGVFKGINIAIQIIEEAEPVQPEYIYEPVRTSGYVTDCRGIETQSTTVTGGDHKEIRMS